MSKVDNATDHFTHAIDTASAGKAHDSSNNALQYNFIDGGHKNGGSTTANKQPTLYQSMTKTLKSDKEGGSNMKTYDLLDGSNSDTIKGRS